MAATATASSVRYAPEDPTLPKPWRGLVDGKTGYLYFWNPETNVTQYERPVSSLLAGPTPAHKSLSSSVHVQKSSQGQNRESSPKNDDNRYHMWGTVGPTKLASGTGNYQASKSLPVHPRDVPNATVVDGAAKGQTSLNAGSVISLESYCRRHEITVTGDNVPPPLTSFDSTGFPTEILREVRYLLQGGAKCRTLCCPLWGLAYIWSAIIQWTNFCEGLSESSKFVATTAVGDDSVCQLVRTDEGESSYCFLWQQALAAACIWGMMLLLVLHAGFSAPTPIQAQSWPVALQGRDIVAIAKTGSGKTLGYLIPGFIHLKRRRNNPQLGPTVLVLSPTRELATQIQDEALKFGKSSKISCTCLYGGAPKGPQLKELDRGTDVVVATPGRLNDILEMRRVSLDQVSYLVLDEADRMLDMGFEPQIRKIVKEVPARRQTLMYTATWPKEVRKIAADLLVNPVQVNIGNVDELVANKSITQYVEVLPPVEKHRRLEQILKSQEPGSKIIIFCSTKKMCDQLARNLTRQFGAAAIHGDKSQSERDFVLNQFRSGRSPVLVATDVAARGLDIKDIRVVINYDFPTGIEDYVHRIGRTGRAGATGEAYTFFGDQDAKYASDLVKVLEGANQRVPVEIRDMALRGGGMGRSRRQWGSGPGGRDGGRGGRYDSNYNGRDGGRGSWTTSYSDRGGGRGRGTDRDSDRYGRSSHDVDASGSFHYRSFHETMARAAEKHSRSRSRSRSRSPSRGSGWGDCRNRACSRSRSPERFDQAPPVRERPVGRSFHESMMQRAEHGGRRENAGGSYENDQGGRSRSQFGEEEEEGMIRAE